MPESNSPQRFSRLLALAGLTLALTGLASGQSQGGGIAEFLRSRPVTAPLGQPPATVPTPSRPGPSGVLDFAMLEKTLNELGYTPEVTDVGQGRKSIKVLGKSGTWDIPIHLSISEDSSSLWLTVRLCSKEDLERAPAATCREMLARNFQISPCFYKLDSNEGGWLTMSVRHDNRGLDNKVLAASLTTLMDFVKEDQRLWDKTKWAAPAK